MPALLVADDSDSGIIDSGSWIIDIGSTDHVTNERGCMIPFSECSLPTPAGKRYITAIGYGVARI